MLRAATVGLAFVVAAISPALAASYDDTWYAADFWSGEYPDGFAVTEDTTVAVRATLDRAAPRDVACALPKGAVYHPWNAARVETDGLAFKSFTRKSPYRVTKALSAYLTPDGGADDLTVDFAPGDEWTFLTYLGEGAFLLEYQGAVYVGQQELVENSEALGPDRPRYEEWMHLTCANGTAGWIFLPDVLGQPGITEPNILGYGEAADLDH